MGVRGIQIWEAFEDRFGGAFVRDFDNPGGKGFPKRGSFVVGEAGVWDAWESGGGVVLGWFVLCYNINMLRVLLLLFIF